jgi:hypothetical protein
VFEINLLGESGSFEGWGAESKEADKRITNLLEK